MNQKEGIFRIPYLKDRDMDAFEQIIYGQTTNVLYYFDKLEVDMFDNIYDPGLVSQNAEFFMPNKIEGVTSTMNKDSMFTYKIGLSGKNIIYERQVYNLLDLVGDIGGLNDGLEVICGFILTILSLLGYRPVESFLVSQLDLDSDD